MEEKTLCGCSWEKDKKRWSARIYINGEQVRLGRFVTQTEAGLAYDYAARKLKRSDLNLPDIETPKEIATAVKIKLDQFQRTKAIDECLAAVDETFWNEGQSAGVQWALENPDSSERVLKIKDSGGIDFCDAYTLAVMIGFDAEFDDYMTGKTRIYIAGEDGNGNVKELPIKKKLHQLAFMRSFLSAAKRRYTEDKQQRERAEQVKSHLEKYRSEQAAAKLESEQAQEAENAVNEATGAPAKLPPVIGPPIYSKHCTPESLADSNAQTEYAKKHRLGIFAMFDDAARRESQKREREAKVEELLAGIL